MERDMDRASCFIIMIDSIKEIGRMISSKVQAINNLQMVQSITEVMLMGSLRVWESIVGQTDSFIRVSGLMDLNMVLGCGKVVKEIVILENGG
jgi:hypothetical protein